MELGVDLTPLVGERQIRKGHQAFLNNNVVLRVTIPEEKPEGCHSGNAASKIVQESGPGAFVAEELWEIM